MTFIYTQVPAADLLPADGSAFRRAAEDAEGGPALKTCTWSPSASIRSPTRRRCSRSTPRRSNADLTRWTFLTGDRDEIDQFASRFGVSIARALNDPRDITHNLRTAIIDADGKLVKVYTGNDWTPEQVLADLKSRCVERTDPGSASRRASGG